MGNIWSFSSTEPELYKLFTSGTIYSISTYGNGAMDDARRSVHEAVVARVRELLFPAGS
jgi:hypothetical protein